MKRYLVFSGPNYYIDGGAWNFETDADNLEEAKGIVDGYEKEHMWAHVFDTRERKIMYEVDGRGE